MTTLATDLPELVFGDPLLTALVTAIVVAAVAYQRGLSYRRYRALHRAKYAAFARLDPVARRHGRPLVRTKHGRDDPEFVAAVGFPPERVTRALVADTALDYHLVATAKRRRTARGMQWAHAQLAAFHDDGTQTEVVVFPAADGRGTALYAHVETAVTDPEGHVTDAQTPGDPRGVLAVETLFG